MPKVVDHEKRREFVGEALWRVIGRKGLGGATVREIATEAGFSTGVLAHYFPGKDDLILFALNLASERTRSRMKRRSEQYDGIDAIRAVLMEGLPLDPVRREEWRVWISFWGKALESPKLMAEQKDRYRQWRTFIAELVETAQRSGEIDASLEACEIASQLLAVVDGLGIQAMYEHRAMSGKRIRSILDLVLVQLSSPDA